MHFVTYLKISHQTVRSQILVQSETKIVARNTGHFQKNAVSFHSCICMNEGITLSIVGCLLFLNNNMRRN